MKFLRFKGSMEARRKKLVAFSFDDGPNSDNILDVLHILGENNIQATFFWIVKNARELKQKNPRLFSKVLNLLDKGEHEVGLHAPFDYQPSLKTIFYGKFTHKELSEAKLELENLTGKVVNLYRPHILFQVATVYFAKQLGLTTVVRDFTKRDYASASAKKDIQIARFSHTQPGSILLFHDGISINRQITYITNVLPTVIVNIRKKGLNPTKVSKVL